MDTQDTCIDLCAAEPVDVTFAHNTTSTVAGLLLAQPATPPKAKIVFKRSNAISMNYFGSAFRSPFAGPLPMREYRAPAGTSSMALPVEPMETFDAATVASNGDCKESDVKPEDASKDTMSDDTIGPCSMDPYMPPFTGPDGSLDPSAEVAKPSPERVPDSDDDRETLILGKENVAKPEEVSVAGEDTMKVPDDLNPDLNGEEKKEVPEDLGEGQLDKEEKPSPVGANRGKKGPRGSRSARAKAKAKAKAKGRSEKTRGGKVKLGKTKGKTKGGKSEAEVQEKRAAEAEDLKKPVKERKTLRILESMSNEEKLSILNEKYARRKERSRLCHQAKRAKTQEDATVGASKTKRGSSSKATGDAKDQGKAGTKGTTKEDMDGKPGQRSMQSFRAQFLKQYLADHRLTSTRQNRKVADEAWMQSTERSNFLAGREPSTANTL